MPHGYSDGSAAANGGYVVGRIEACVEGRYVLMAHAAWRAHCSV